MASAHGSVDLCAERGVDDQPPVAQLVAEPLDQQGAVVRDVPGGLALLAQVAEQVVGGPVVQAGARWRAAGRRRRATR